MKTILHVDMDAFFASVEASRHPEWRGKPIIVGADPHERGVVSTCSYEARKFGVHSAMPSQTAYQLCPTAIFVHPHMSLYQEVSAMAFKVFSNYSPYVESVSIDEAFLDITGTIHLHHDARQLGEALKNEIRRQCGVTCSVGIAPNRLLAKIGSEQHKPDGLTIMPFQEQAIIEFLRDKPIGILWGIGKKTIETLRPYGIVTCGDLQKLKQEQLYLLFGNALAKTISNYAHGYDSSEVNWMESDEKSVSREHTFSHDEIDQSAIRTKLLELVEEVGQTFRKKPRWAKTARLKLRDSNFNTITRQLPFDAPSRDNFAFRKAALKLFESERIGCLRLIGFGVTNIQQSPDNDQPQLFESCDDEMRKRHERLSSVIDNLRDHGMSIK